MPVARRRRDTASTGDAGQRRPGEQRADASTAPRSTRSGVDGVGLRHDREPVADAERVEQRQVFERLRARAVVGRDDQHRGVDLAGADEHVADQLVVPRDVDEVELGAVVEREVRVADVDRHPAPPFLGQPVGVDAGQRAEQRRLAVVDVAGRADDDGHAPSGEDRLRRRPRASVVVRVPARRSAGRGRPGRPRSGR